MTNVAAPTIARKNSKPETKNRPLSAAETLSALLAKAGINVPPHVIGEEWDHDNVREATAYARAVLRALGPRPSFLPGASNIEALLEDAVHERAPDSGERRRDTISHVAYRGFCGGWEQVARLIGDEAADASIEFERAIGAALSWMGARGATGDDVQYVEDYLEAARDHARRTVVQIRILVKDLEEQRRAAHARDL